MSITQEQSLSGCAKSLMPKSNFVYFPVSQKPLEMRASLKSHPSDFGNGSYDKLYFQFDENKDRYIANKLATSRHRYGFIEPRLPLHSAVLKWCKSKLEEEHPVYWGGISSYLSLSNKIQEDFAVIAEDGTVVATYISFPSNWAPERILGSGFSDIHKPVPDFPKNKKESELGRLYFKI